MLIFKTLYICLLLCVNNVCSAGPTIVFIVFHSVLSSQPINGETFVLSLESIHHDLSHIFSGNLHLCFGTLSKHAENGGHNWLINEPKNCYHATSSPLSHPSKCMGMCMYPCTHTHTLTQTCSTYRSLYIMKTLRKLWENPLNEKLPKGTHFDRHPFPYPMAADPSKQALSSNTKQMIEMFV